VTCGTLTVPERHDRPEGPQVRLAVAVVRVAGERRPDPVVYLSGGPGSPALVDALTFAEAWRTFLRGRDFIVLDQRGTGRSLPSLRCPEVEESNASLLAADAPPAERSRAEVAALHVCATRLRAEGVNLAAYHTAASALDLRALRLALGYERWNLLGISYGTRLALAAQQADPQGVRALVLDSAYPPQANMYTELPANLDRSLDMLLEACAADRRCGRAYPNLAATLTELTAQLDASPVTVTVDLGGGTTREVRVDGGRFVELLFRMLYRSNVIPRLPRLITDTHAGRTGLLAELMGRRLRQGKDFAHALFYSEQCRADLGRSPPDVTSPLAAAHPRLRTYLAGLTELTPEGYAICAAWGIPPEPSAAHPVTSNVPALLLAGAYDPITPPHWGHAAAATLPRAQVIAFPGTGHAAIGRGACPVEIIRQFLDRPDRPVDSRCAPRLGGPAWELR
jgi:pimeloyl-ACP methyl ester carboxylesterase